MRCNNSQHTHLVYLPEGEWGHVDTTQKLASINPHQKIGKVNAMQLQAKPLKEQGKKMVHKTHPPATQQHPKPAFVFVAIRYK